MTNNYFRPNQIVDDYDLAVFSKGPFFDNRCPFTCLLENGEFHRCEFTFLTRNNASACLQNHFKVHMTPEKPSSRHLKCPICPGQFDERTINKHLLACHSSVATLFPRKKRQRMSAIVDLDNSDGDNYDDEQLTSKKQRVSNAIEIDIDEEERRQERFENNDNFCSLMTEVFRMSDNRVEVLEMIQAMKSLFIMINNKHTRDNN